MTKVLATVQSNYIPWKGYFDLINMSDEFVLYDSAQYTRRDWRNRNKIKTASGLLWLTIPVQVKGKYHQAICETRVSDSSWADEHWKTIVHHYARAPYFAQYRDVFESLYQDVAGEVMLSQINYRFLGIICDILGIKTRLTWSMGYDLVGDPTEKLVQLCQQTQSTEYLSGPSARGYMDESRFADAGIKLTYMDYSDYPEYTQLFPPFDHHVSIIDLLFNTGPNAPEYMKSFCGS